MVQFDVVWCGVVGVWYGVGVCFNALGFVEDVDKVEWESRAIQLRSNIEIIVFEAVKGGYAINDTQGDIAIDNILVTAGRCQQDGTTTKHLIKLHY